MKGRENELMAEYLDESFENLASVAEELTQLENDGSNLELINSIYRKVHTLKGSAAFLGFKKQQEFTHILENTLDLVREQKIKVSPELIDTVLKCMDAEEAYLKNVERDAEEGEVDTSELIKELLALENSEQSEAKVEPEAEIKEEAVEQEIKTVEEARTVEVAVPAPEEVKPEVVKKAPAEEKPISSGGSATADTTIRVKVELLDSIMNVVGELVLTRNQILQFTGEHELPELNRLSQQLNSITTELQTDVMTTRMQPIGSTLHKYERILRDLCRKTGKSIKLELIGQDTELDKNLLESIKDPLTHIVRNAVDHGIETKEERDNTDKPAVAKLVIKAYHEGGQVVIEIKDDGRGINRDVITKKAIERNILTEDQAKRLSDKNVFNLLFLPSFSTAAKVTDISGRGVGMDVVKTNVEKIGGTVEIDSELGKGTTISLKIPLTLAIIPALIVESEGEPFTFPQVNLVELVRLEGEEVDNKIEHIQGADFFLLRGELIPIFKLNNTLTLTKLKDRANTLRSFGNKKRRKVKKRENNVKEANIVILNAEGSIYGIVVDSILDTQEIVVKPLSKNLKRLDQYAGATVMGDGEVALIIDSLGFYRKLAGTLSDRALDINAGHDSMEMDKRVNMANSELVLFSAADLRIYGLPLTEVSRLEKFEKNKIEKSGDKFIIRYRESTLPLINFEKTLGIDAQSDLQGEDELINCIVVTSHDYTFGIVVHEIRDITKLSELINEEISDRDEIKGTTYIDGKVITVVDVEKIILKQGYTFFQSTEHSNKKFFKDRRILVVEDSKIYQNAECDFFRKNGLDVTLAKDGAEGVEALTNLPQFDFIVTDIEMPNMDGYGFTRAARKLENYIKTPIVAITTRVEKKSVDKGLAAGIDEYVEKFDGNKVLEVIRGLI